MRYLLFLFFCAFFIGQSTGISNANDKSGVKPNVLKLPTGPGSIEGLGESFQPQLNSGTASYSVPLTLPPGRNGSTPGFALVYNGGSGNGSLGIGWKTSFSPIQRRTDKGLPVYDDTKDIFVSPGGEELVEVEAGIYREENEGSFNRYERVGNDNLGWLVHHKNGTKSWYGVDASSRLASGGYIFRWTLSKSVDSNGNIILYRYNEEQFFDDSSAPIDNNLYLTTIYYNFDTESDPGMRVEFYYDTRPDYDQPVSYKGRFPVRTSQRCSEIVMSAGGQRARSYKLFYEQNKAFSRLQRIKTYGRNEAQGPLASILSFTYTNFSLSNTISAIDQGFSPSVGLESNNVDLADINGDSLPDLLHTDLTHQVYFNDGNDGWLNPFTISGSFGDKQLSQTNTMVMDMDGDGFTDLFSQDLSISGYTYNRGKPAAYGWDYYPVEMSNTPSFSFGDTVKPLDLDNDGRVDILRKNNFSTEISCVFNLQGQMLSSEFSLDSPSTQAVFNFGSESESPLRLADMNGDGLQDFIVLKEEGQIWYYPARGVTWDSSTPWSMQGWDNTPQNWPSGISGAEGYWMDYAPDSIDDPDLSLVTNFKQLRLLDANGDGLTDLVYVGNNKLSVWLNRGGHEFSTVPYSILSTEDVIPDLTAQTHIRAADMNGNGTTDIVWNRQTGFAEIGRPGTTWLYLDLSGDVKPNLLATIENGIGGVTEITYKSSVDYLVADRIAGFNWPDQVPIPVNVVSSIGVNDGLGHSYQRQFTYHDGYYDGEEKEFRGFARVEQSEIGDESIAGLITENTFDTGVVHDSLKGKPLMLETRTQEGDIFFQESNIWRYKVLGTDISGGSREVAFAYRSGKLKQIIEKGHGDSVTQQWDYEYDDYGNMISELDYGRLDSGWDDERKVTTVFSAANPTGITNWLLDKVILQTTSDENGAKAGEKRFYYDELPLGQVLEGNQTQIEDWVAGTTYQVSRRSDYDQYGNVLAAYDGLYGIEPGHYRTFTYDSNYHTFPVSETIYTGNTNLPTLEMFATYDYGFGQVVSSADFNGHSTDYGHDTWGRLISITRPGDTLPTLSYEYVLGHDLSQGKTINWVETRQREDINGGTVDSRIFSDGLGRKIMTRSEGEEPHQIVVSDTQEFNNRKLPWKKYLPYFETGGLDYSDPTWNSGYTEHFYDALGREIRTNQPIGPEGISFSTTEYTPFTKLVRDEEQTNSGSNHYNCGYRYVEDGLLDKDGKGRLREVFEIVKLADDGTPLSSPVEWRTQYSYDLLDKLTDYIDSQNNQKFIEYDGLGRKTFMNDPDRGHMYYLYDEAGNLSQTTDAKSQVIRYSYDGINRLEKEFYGIDSTIPEVYYHYDVPAGPLEMGDWWMGPTPETLTEAILQEGFSEGFDLNGDGALDVSDVVSAGHLYQTPPTVTATNTKGFLAWVEDQSGEEHNSYDEHGRVSWRVKRIKSGPEDELQNFYTGMAYDSMDRVTELTYPDRSNVHYTYNSRGLLEEIAGIITGYDYNPVGQNQQLIFSPNIITSYSYDHRLRLATMQSIRQPDGFALQNLSYSYDRVSNIKEILDSRTDETLQTINREMGLPITHANQFNGTQRFSYDSLYRLTNTSNPQVFGIIDYRYDRIGNMISKDANLIATDPLMNLGEMHSGGNSGTWNKVGRDSGYDPGPHALTSTEKGTDGPLVYSYDDNGNMVTNRGMNLVWDFTDRLVGFTKDGMNAEYLYDYKNSRSIKRVKGLEQENEETLYVDKFSELRRGKLVKYAYAGSSRIARLAQNTSTPEAYYLQDHLGSTTFSLLPTGIAEEQMVNYPFGRERIVGKSNQGEILADYKFTGKELDEESDLMYFEARYYDAVVGKFVSVDPLYVSIDDIDEMKLGMFLSVPNKTNLYAYVINNPLKYSDPNGTEEQSEVENYKKAIDGMTEDLRTDIKRITDYYSDSRFEFDKDTKERMLYEVGDTLEHYRSKAKDLYTKYNATNSSQKNSGRSYIGSMEAINDVKELNQSLKDFGKALTSVADADSIVSKLLGTKSPIAIIRPPIAIIRPWLKLGGKAAINASEISEKMIKSVEKNQGSSGKRISKANK